MPAGYAKRVSSLIEPSIVGRSVEIYSGRLQLSTILSRSFLDGIKDDDEFRLFQTEQSEHAKVNIAILKGHKLVIECSQLLFYGIGLPGKKVSKRRKSINRIVISLEITGKAIRPGTKLHSRVLSRLESSLPDYFRVFMISSSGGRSYSRIKTEQANSGVF